MKIMLISPPAIGLKDKLAYPPLGLLYLASNLSIEADVKVLNMVSEDEEIENGYDIYGISIHSPAPYMSAVRIINKIRENNKDTLIVAGGAFPSSMPQFVKDNLDIDFVICGEGEKTFNFVANAKIQEANDKRAWRLSISLIDNLDTIKFPARHLLPKEQIKHEGSVHHTDKPATTILATRGCPYNCNFCDTTMWQRKYRVRSPENIAQEIEQVINDYGIEYFRFPDDCLTINKKWFTEFCNKMKELNIEWTMLARADSINSEMLELAKSSGLREVFFGIESGSQRILDLMNKRITVEKNLSAIKLCKEVGITSCIYIMFGFPGENEESVNETIKFLQEAKPDKSRIHQFLAISGTDVWNNPNKYKIKLKYNWEDYYDFLDNPNLTLDYLYLNNGDIFKLREKIKDFYIKEGYLENWNKNV